MFKEINLSLVDTLLDRLSSREDLELEFKSAQGGLPHDLWPTISAFANTQGGWVILGVHYDEDTEVTKLQGVGNPSFMLRNFYNLMRNPQKISASVCGANDAQIEQLGEHQVIVIRVPAAPRKSRPIYINGNPYDGTYLRRNSGDYHCTKAEVDRMMREASDVAADSAVLKNFTWADLDLDTLARYRRQFQTRVPNSSWNEYDNETFLEVIRGYRRDRETGEEGITVAGLFLLGKQEAIREWHTPHAIDYRLVPHDSNIGSDARWEDRLLWEGNLFDGFTAIYRRLIEELPIPFRLQDGVRVEHSAIHTALREALVNLLVHTDYAETHSSMVVRSSNGYLFRNLGNSRVLETDILTGGRSDPRNPELVRMFRIAGLAEEAGTGIPNIIRT